MERDPPTATLLSLEDSSEVVVGEDWQKAIDRTLLDNLGKYRKYDGKSVRDLLRVLRNKVCLLFPGTKHDKLLILSFELETSLPRSSGVSSKSPRRSTRRIPVLLHHSFPTPTSPRIRHSLHSPQ